MNRVKIRNFRWNDLPAVVDTINRAAEVDQDRGASLDNLRRELDAPHAQPEADSFVAVAPTGELVGFCGIRFLRHNGWAGGWGAVRPDHRRQRIGTRLLQTCDARLLERAQVKVPQEKPVYIDRNCSDVASGTIALLTAEGYKATRQFYTMRVNLDTPGHLPPLPQGLTLRPFAQKQHARTVYQAQQEAFRDHWGYSSDMPYDAWSHLLLGDPNFDPSLWLVAWDGDEVAGVCLGTTRDGEGANLAWVRVLAVRRPWRKRGLGTALLLYSLSKFHACGLAQAGLNVDAANTTNAVALYERVGMHVHRRRILYRKVLRGRKEDIQE
jgi:mycothiol synthase